jgi:putative membrane protein
MRWRRPQASRSAQNEGRPPDAHAREYMASERTYLAWLRTTASLMVLGLAVAKFGSSNIAYALGAGSILLAVAGAGLWYATLRYVRINREIAQGRFTTGSSVHGPIIVAVIFACAIVVVLVLILP